ncbi:VTT domain-containing protein [Ruminococcus sp. Marseille-P6503]|uniref:TVP38/TMEM64 family protein n=1 Tax=Ruminococcus sp. Marseille-P6503 TaxID=2364796 RepID=UPI000F51BD58|nr:VTT domain-containing protein [Ruminococcus sp. Marseille-P6503]
MRDKDSRTNNETEEMRKARMARHRKRVQILSLAVFFAALAGATYLMWPFISSLKTDEGMESIRETLSRYGSVAGVLIFTAIQAVQVIIAIVPPIQIVGGLLFGWFFGAVLSFVGVVLGSLVIFLLVKKIGTPVVEAFVDEKQIKKFKFLQDERKLTGILIVLYLIPGIPKDVLTYIVPLTKISTKDFFMYVMPCRLPAIVMSTVLGSNVGSGNFRIAVIIVAAFMVIGIIGFFFKDAILNKIKQHKKQK